MTSRPPASLARRAVPALALAGASGVFLHLLDQPAGGATALGTTARADTPAAGAPGVGAGASATPTTTAPTVQAPPIGEGDEGDEGFPGGQPPFDAGDEGEGGFPAPAGASPSTSAPSRPSTRTPSSTVPAAPSASCTGTKVTGPVISTRWGPVQVSAVVSSAHQLCDVEALQTPSAHRKSVFINQQAVPILHDEAMAAQSASIDAVSGATITSVAYAQSLQAILDRG